MARSFRRERDEVNRLRLRSRSLRTHRRSQREAILAGQDDLTDLDLTV